MVQTALGRHGWWRATRKARSARLQVMIWQYPFCCGASSKGTESPALTPKEGRG